MKSHAPPPGLPLHRAVRLLALTVLSLSAASLWAAPTIDTQPANATSALGAAASICVTATSSGGPLTYQWRLNGGDVSGATDSCYNLGSVQKTDTGLYTCLVSDNNGPTLSASAILFLDKVLAFFDDFNSGGLTFGQWSPCPSWAVLEVNPSDMTRTDHDGTPTAYIRHNGKKMYHQITPIAMTGNHFQLSAYIYDDGNGAGTDGILEFRGYSGGTYGSGTLNQLLAVAKYTVGLSSSTSAYQKRIYNPGAAGYTAFASPPVPSLGWHFFMLDVNGTTLTFSVDGTQVEQNSTATAATLNSISVGGNGSSTGMYGDSWADDVKFEIFTGGNPINPAFGTQPVAATRNANLGDSVTFTAAATAPNGNSNPGGDRLGYQWMKNGAAIASATTTSFPIANPQLSDSGTYACVAYHTGGALKSADAALVVTNLPPMVTGQNPPGSPPDYAVTPGSTANFSVTGRASNPIDYRWYKGTPPSGTPVSNDARISGALTYALSIASASPADNGTYYCHLSNDDSPPADSAAVNLVVPTCPVINTQPANVTNGLGSNVTFTVDAAGSSLNYLWSKNGSPVSNGAKYSNVTTPTLGVANLVDGDAGTYTCTITTSGCSPVTTDPATLTVVHRPMSADVSPVLQQVNVGGTASFTVAQSGGALPVTYQWQHDGSPISGATDSAYSFSPAGTAAGGNYCCVVANPGGSVLSTCGALLVPFSWKDDFESYNVANLDKNKGGNPAPNGSGNPWWGTGGANLNVINLEHATPHNQSQTSNMKMVRSAYGDLGSSFYGGDMDLEFINLGYRFNGGNPFYGDFACEWWFYDQYGTGNAVNDGGTVRRTDYNDEVSICYYAGNMPADTDYSGAPAAPYSLTQRLSIGACSAYGALDDTRYQVAIMGVSDGVAWSGPSSAYPSAQYFNAPLARSIGWHHARIVVGPADASTHVAAVQYFIDDMNNPQVTKVMPEGSVGCNSLELTTSWSSSTSGNTAMGYFDDFGFQFSATEPWIVQQPASFAVAAGQPATVTVVASTASYQWKKNGSAIGGATDSSYTIPTAGAGDAASYTCVLTGAAGTLESGTGVLNVVNGIYGAGTGLQAAYFNNTTLADPASLTRTDLTVNFDGGSGANFTDVPVGPSNFSARWRGAVQPGFSETYTFYTASDDGVRLWVGNTLLIDHWVGQSPREWSGTIALTAGQLYPLTLEYYQGTGGDSVTLSWSSAHTAKDIIPSSALYLPPEPLTCTLYGTDLVVSWSPAVYTLTSATNVAGPYLDVPAPATNPCTNSVLSAQQRFFKLRY